MGRFKAWLVDFILNRTPLVSDLLGFLDGYKTQVGQWGVLISTILFAVMTLFPQLQFMPEVYTYWMMIASWLFQQLGLEHKVIKGEFIQPEKEATEAAS